MLDLLIVNGLIYSEGVVKRRMPLHRFVDVTSANAAKIFGLYPTKEAIAVGSEADLTIIDPFISETITNDDLHLSDYSPWEGWEIQGWPVTMLLRGKVMVEDRKLVAGPGHGQLLTNHSIATECQKEAGVLTEPT